MLLSFTLAIVQVSTFPVLSVGDASPAAVNIEQPVPGVPAGFWWEDYDRDGLPDAFAIGSNGAARLLHNQGDGSFADVTRISGLAGLGTANFATWCDYDRDSAPDLFVGMQTGCGRLLRNARDGTFQDVTEFVGLARTGHALEAQWFDYDLDGASDLLLRTDTSEELYHALPDGIFEAVELKIAEPLAVVPIGPSILDRVAGTGRDPTDADTPDGHSPSAHRRPPARNVVPPLGVAGIPSNHPTPSRLGGPVLNIATCTDVIKDQAIATCISASSTPTMGWLYPLSTNLNVSAAGNVGIGTASPAFKLDVAGTARMTGTLTLNPSGDQALNVSTGSIYKGGALFIHTKGGLNNSALGADALGQVTVGSKNTATGSGALYTNTSGSSNTASGYSALRSNSTGGNNTATGTNALVLNTTGIENTADGMDTLRSNTIGARNLACGSDALRNNTSGSENAACGFYALFNNTSGDSNTALGWHAGYNLTNGSHNIDIASYGTAGESNTTRIGRSATTNRAFIAGIRGITTGNANAIPVLIDSNGQLGTVSSSRRFKKDIHDMGDATAKLLELRPVTFHYKQEQTLPDGSALPPEYGLIAEEVAEIMPDLVVYDDQGKPFTVKYHMLSAMLLNELKKQASVNERQTNELEGLKRRLETLENRTASVGLPTADGHRAAAATTSSR